jgi:parvulin-like peptidyl-prolyl isomerase
MKLKTGYLKSSREEAVAKHIKTGFAVMGVVVVLSTVLAAFFLLRPQIIAHVGSEKITTAEFKFFLRQIKDGMLEIAGYPDQETFWRSKIEGEYAIDIAKKSAIESARELKVQVIKAEERNISLSKQETEQLNSRIDDILYSEGGVRDNKKDKDKFLLDNYDVNLNGFRDIMRQYRLREILVQKESEAMVVEDTDIEEYYEKYPNEYKKSAYRENGEEALWVRHIRIALQEKASEEENKKALEKAEEVLEKIKSGGDFEQLAAEYSEDNGSGSYDSSYVFGMGRIPEEFRDTVLALEPGRVSEVVETEIGFVIIKLEERYKEGEPVSARCAKEYWEYGDTKVKALIYRERLNEWLNQYEFKINESVYKSIP